MVSYADSSIIATIVKTKGSYTQLDPVQSQIRLLTAEERRLFTFYGCVLIEDAFLPVEVPFLQAMAEEVLQLPPGSGVTQAFEQVPAGKESGISTSHVAQGNNNNNNNNNSKDATTKMQQLCRVEGFVPRHTGFAALARDRLAPLAAQLLGEECHLFKEKMNIKHPNGGGGYAAHFDGPSAASVGLAERFVTAQLAIDDQTLNNGTLQVVMPRCACPWFVDDKEDWQCAASVMAVPTDADPDAGGRVGAILPEIASSLDWQAVPCRAGAVLLFDGFFPHRSAPNYSDTARRTAYFLFNGESDGGDCHDSYRQIMAAARRTAAAKTTANQPIIV